MNDKNKKLIILDFSNSKVIIENISETCSENIEKYLVDVLNFKLSDIEYMVSDKLDLDIKI